MVMAISIKERGARGLAIRRIDNHIMGDLGLPPISVREIFFLVVEQLIAGLGGELEVRPLDDGVDRTGLLAQSAIDAFGHVDVVARRAPAAVVARLGLDRDRQCGADRLAQLARDAALLAIGIAPQGMFTAKSDADRSLLIGIV